MTRKYRLHPDEIVLFEGDVTWLQHTPGPVRATAVVTDQRVIVSPLPGQHRKADILSTSEQSHGPLKKMVFTLRGGGRLSLVAVNEGGLKAAGLILTGQFDDGLPPAGPVRGAVGDATAWLAALGPLLSVLLVAVPCVVVWGMPHRWLWRDLAALAVAQLMLVWLLLCIDLAVLRRQGIGLKALGIAGVAPSVRYLFRRAAAFRHGKAYAVTWGVSMLGVVLLQGLLFALTWRR